MRLMPELALASCGYEAHTDAMCYGEINFIKRKPTQQCEITVYLVS